jgi:hypothetical protein
LYQYLKFQNEETRFFFLKAWAENVSVIDVDDICILVSIHVFVNDIESIENLLQKYSLNQVFLKKHNVNKMNRFNQSLNIQWALNIISNFPKV